MVRNRTKNVTAAITGLALAITGCKQSSSDSASVAPTKKLYISSGVCSSGTGITTFTAQTSSRRVSKLDLTTKTLETVFDLTAPYVGGSFGIDTGAQGIVDNGSTLLLMTENAVAMSDRKIYSIPKASPFNAQIYSQDPLALTQTAAHITRALKKDVDGALIFSKSIALEKIGINTLRIPQGVNPWVNAPAAPCATSTTNMSDIALLSPYPGYGAGKILFTHQGATAITNILGSIGADGYSVAANCTGGAQINLVSHSYATNVTGPLPIVFAATGSSPTSAVFIPTGTAPGVVGKLIVSYSASVAAETSNNVNLNYAIVSWTVTESSSTAVTLTAPKVLSRQLDAVFGISAMAYDPSDSSLYVATASQTGVMNQTTAGYGYKVEKFTLDVSNDLATLVRVNNQPFMDRSAATKCITSMAIGQE